MLYTAKWTPKQLMLKVIQLWKNCCCPAKKVRRWLLHEEATRGVTVSMFAFLACHQCYCAGSSLAWGLNLRAVVCGIF